jgi:hypothetical protein
VNSTHVTVGTGAISAMAALTTLLTGFKGLDADHAAAAAWLICAAVGGIGMIVTWYVQRKWPDSSKDKPI